MAKSVIAVGLLLLGALFGVLATNAWPKVFEDSKRSDIVEKAKEPAPVPNHSPPAPTKTVVGESAQTLTQVDPEVYELKPLLGVTKPVTYQLRGCRGIYLYTEETNKPDAEGHTLLEHAYGFVDDGNRLAILPFPNGTWPPLDLRPPSVSSGTAVLSYLLSSNPKNRHSSGHNLAFPTDHLVGDRKIVSEARHSLKGKPGDRVVLFQSYLMDNKGEQFAPDLTGPKFLGPRREGQPNAVRLTVFFLFLAPDADYETEVKKFDQETLKGMRVK